METLDFLLTYAPGVLAASVTLFIHLIERASGVRLPRQRAALFLSFILAIFLWTAKLFIDPETFAYIVRQALVIFALQMSIYEVFIGKRGIKSLFVGIKK